MFPAPKNSNDLNNEWLIVCINAPHNASVATTSLPDERAIVEIPKPMKITPIFSILEYANNLFTSFCTAAKITPHKPVTIPAERIMIPAMCKSALSEICQTTRIIPYTPVLIITPDIIAETCDGAAG